MHLHVKWQKTQVFIFHNISQATLLEECLDKNFLHIPNVSTALVILLQTFLFDFFCSNTANKNFLVSQTKIPLIDASKYLIVNRKNGDKLIFFSSQINIFLQNKNTCTPLCPIQMNSKRLTFPNLWENVSQFLVIMHGRYFALFVTATEFCK